MATSLNPREDTRRLFLYRTLVAIVLLPLGLWAIHLGGAIFAWVVALILSLAAWEYMQLFRVCGYQPAGVVLIGSVTLLAIGRSLNGFESAPWILSLAAFTSTAYHLVAYERGRDQAATDLAITLAGVFYIGWLGSYLISLRSLPDGEWWLLTVLPAIWFADSGAYLVGKAIGRRPLTRRVSPKKTWEGYVGGLVFSMLGTALLAAIWHRLLLPGPQITALNGALLGFLIALLAPIGDLGESMIKRQAGAKDSGKILPGHGGVFDRIDTWLWTAPIGFYIVLWLLR